MCVAFAGIFSSSGAVVLVGGLYRGHDSRLSPTCAMSYDVFEWDQQAQCQCGTAADVLSCLEGWLFSCFFFGPFGQSAIC